MARKTTPKVSPVFTRVRKWIRKYSVIPDDYLDISTVWAMGTWTFEKGACIYQPVTYPYLYITGARGSGKTVLGQDVFSYITRRHKGTVNMTGPTLFRIMGVENEETGEIENLYPTLSMDEIDATFNGAKDEHLRLIANAGYKEGATVPRSSGKSYVDFPVYGPKILIGIDNGHLPDTITDRCIRMDIVRATPDEMKTIEPLWSFDVAEETAEIREEMAQWAKDNAAVLRDYRPTPIEGLPPRGWEIARSLIQLAHAIGNEEHMREVLHRVMTANPERPSGKVMLYQSIFNLFNELEAMGVPEPLRERMRNPTFGDRVSTRDILARLRQDGVQVPGMNGTGLKAVLSEDGVGSDLIRFPRVTVDGVTYDHPSITGEDIPQRRGYMRHSFDGPFTRFLGWEGDDDE